MPPLRLSLPRALSLAAALACLLGALYLRGAVHDEQALRRANDAGLRGDLAGVVAAVRDVHHDPAAARARKLEAFAQLQAGDLGAALPTFAAAARALPNDWEIRRGWAVALLRAGRPAAANRQFARATALNPDLQLPIGFER